MDAWVAERIRRRTDRGFRAYFVETARELVADRSMDYRIRTDRETLTCRALFVAVANARQYGYGMRIAPTARLDDGLLDVVVVQDRSLAGNLARVPSLFGGRIHKAKGIATMKVKEIAVDAGTGMFFHVDGEPAVGNRQLTGRVHPGALKVLA
jgi:diacylglycerol kinase (ATP)